MSYLFNIEVFKSEIFSIVVLILAAGSLVSIFAVLTDPGVFQRFKCWLSEITKRWIDLHDTVDDSQDTSGDIHHKCMACGVRFKVEYFDFDY